MSHRPIRHSPLLVFSDDWGRHPSSMQHLAGHLLGAGHDITWVNTIGTRKPGFNLLTLRRAAGKLRQWARPRPGAAVASGGLPEGLTVLNPRMWPAFASPLDRRINRHLLMRSLAPRVPAGAVGVTTLPIVADLMGLLPVSHWVYYCVDDFSRWPGLDGRTLARLERRVLERADRVVCVSEHLRERVARLGRGSELLTHGVDVEFWQDPAAAALPELPAGPRVVFWGVIDRRMDLGWLERLSARMAAGCVVLAGPENEPDPRLSAIPRVHRCGPLPLASLPALAREAGVLVMPYADLPVTRAMQPLKLKEYLATGRPCVARDLPANRAWAGALDLVGSAEEFAARVCERLDRGLPDSQKEQRARLVGESWARKAEQFGRWLLPVTPPGPTA